MKRVAVKRRKAGPGAKRKAPRRRPSAKTSAAPKTRATAGKRRKPAKAKAASPPKRATTRKPVARKPRLKVSRLAVADLPVSGKRPALELDLPVAPQATTKALAKTKVPRRSRPRGATTKPNEVIRIAGLKIPPILLEGDEPESHPASGPGEKFSLGPETPAAHFAAAPTHLPASYGTGKLFLTARDPHWIYAHWDINPRTQFQHNARSVDRHLILRMHESDLDSKPAAEIHVHPESRHWFAHVNQAGTQYVADLGYYQPGRKWKSLATSAPMRTPPDSVSTDATVEFATIPPELPFETMLSLLEEGEEQELPLAHAIQHLRDRRLREIPVAPPMTEWTPEQERALTEILATSHGKPALRGSEESAGLPSEVAAIENLPTGPALFDVSSYLSGENVSSHLGGEANVGREFWLNVNAELIIYGATEPNAQVTIGGKSIALRADGSFRYRFALPDGKYELPVVAVAADNSDGRVAELKFTRDTRAYGTVGAQPTDPALKPPTPEAL